MINIRAIDIKKCYKWAYVLLTCAMCFMAFQVLAIDSSMAYVQAKGMGESDNLMEIRNDKDNRSKLFVLILNKTFPAMEVNYLLEHGDDGYPKLYKLALGKLIKFDYQDPRTLLRAQLPVLGEINDDLAEVSYNFPTGEPNESTDNDVKKEREIMFVEENPRLDVKPTNSEDNDVPTSTSQDIQSEESVASNIPIVTSPIKMPNKVRLSTKEPIILIYYTHGTESYMPETVGNFHSLNEKYTVRAVGEELTKLLNNKGFKVVNDKTLHDYPSYNQSYIRAAETLKNNFKENQSIKIVLDIHRDAAPNNDEARQSSYITINNEKVAKYAIVVGTANENAEELLTFAGYFKAISDELYPDLAKKTIPREFKYNQYYSDYYALVEVGNTANNIEEAVRTSKYLAEILEKVIISIRE